MNPTIFPEANKKFCAPADMDESQVLTIDAYSGQVSGGSLDGCAVVVTAWKPMPDEISAIVDGRPIFISFIGGLPPHYPSMDFNSATHPA